MVASRYGTKTQRYRHWLQNRQFNQLNKQAKVRESVREELKE